MGNQSLREKFTDARLAEMFSRPDVVEYLSTRPQNYDKWMEVWVKIATQLFPNKEEYGEIVSRFERPLKRLGVGGAPVYDFLRYFLCQSEEVEVYSLYPNYLVKFPMSFEGRAFGTAYCVVGRAKSELTAEDVVRTLAHFCWHRDGAKELLLTRIQKLVEEEKARAQRDFDSACAVSDDGTKITIADRVIVVKEDGTLPVFSAELFRDQKITRPAEMERVKAWRTKDVYQAIEMVRRDTPAVYVAAYGMGKLNDDLVVKEKFVPQPLPGHSGAMTRDIL